MVLCMIHWDTKRISTHIWIHYPSSGTVPLGPIYNYIRCSRIRDREVYQISIIFSYVSCYLWKLLGFTSWGEDHWHLSEDARVTDDSRDIMPTRKTSQGTLHLHAYHWYRSHHKVSSCQPVSAQAVAFTGDLGQQHLFGQDMAYRLALSWRTCSVHFPLFSSIFRRLAPIPWSP